MKELVFFQFNSTSLKTSKVEKNSQVSKILSRENKQTCTHYKPAEGDEQLVDPAQADAAEDRQVAGVASYLPDCFRCCRKLPWVQVCRVR